MDLKKTGCVVSLLISCNPALSGTMGEPSAFPRGFAIIGGIGVTEFMSAAKYDTVAGDMHHTYSPRNFQYGFAGDLAVGYGFFLKRSLYLGTELGVTFLGNTKNKSASLAASSTNVNDETLSRASLVNDAISTQSTVIENSVVPYFDLKPGIVISPQTWLYGRIGINYNQIKVKTNSQYNSSGGDLADSEPLAFTSEYTAFSATSKRNAPGLRTGLGIDYLVSKNFGISANYIYSYYNRLKTNGSSSSKQLACDTVEGCPAVDGPFTTTGTTKASDSQVLLELIYHLT